MTTQCHGLTYSYDRCKFTATGKNAHNGVPVCGLHQFTTRTHEETPMPHAATSQEGGK